MRKGLETASASRKTIENPNNNTDMFKHRLFYVLIFLFPWTTGCGQKTPDGMPPLLPLTLQVTQMGQPFPEASVSLLPVDGSSTWSSGGLTGPDGSLVVFTHGKYSGIPAGKYKVTVDCVTSDPPAPKNASLEEMDAHNRKHPAFRIVPIEYTERNSTPLEIEVVKGTNRLTVDVSEKVKLDLGGPP